MYIVLYLLLSDSVYVMVEPVVFRPSHKCLQLVADQHCNVHALLITWATMCSSRLSVSICKVMMSVPSVNST